MGDLNPLGCNGFLIPPMHEKEALFLLNQELSQGYDSEDNRRLELINALDCGWGTVNCQGSGCETM
jgi:hypothetical protein